MQDTLKVLRIDGLYGVNPKDYVRLVTADDILGYIERYSGVQGAVLRIDARFLSDRLFTRLLKLLEEHTGGIDMLVADPVPATVLSRFSVIKKRGVACAGTLADVRLRVLPNYLKEKIGILFDLKGTEQ